MIDPHGEGDRAEAPAPPTGTALGALVGRSVRLDGVEVGSVHDVVLNPSLTQVVGVDVMQAGSLRFVPWMLLRQEAGELALVTADALRERSAIGLILQHGVRLSRVPQPAALVSPSGELERPPAA